MRIPDRAVQQLISVNEVDDDEEPLSKDDLMRSIYKKGLFGFGAGVILAVNAETPVQGFPPESINPGFSEMNGLGAAANRSLLLSGE